MVWFEIPADKPERAKKFYSSLFGWTIEAFPGMTDYWHIATGGGDDAPDGSTDRSDVETRLLILNQTEAAPCDSWF
ncbi:MAG: hypothetical protein ABI856_15440 [Nitrospira sp.]